LSLSACLLLVTLPVRAAAPSDPAELRRLAASYAAVDDPRASDTYEKAIAAAPADFPLRVEYAQYLWHSGERDKGNHQMDRVIRLAPENPRLRAHYGVNLAEQGKYVAAAEQLEAARSGGFDNADVLFYLGSVLWETGRLDEAAARLREAVAKDPKKVSARHRLGRLLIFQGKAAEAVTELTKASELEPHSIEVLLDLGRALEAAGNPAKAEASYRLALEIPPEAPLAHYLLGTLLARNGKRREAAEHIAFYQRAFTREQENRYRSGARQAEVNLGWTRLKEKHFEDALAQFRRWPDDVEALRGAAQALSELGRHGEAVEALERALLLEPDNRPLRYALDRERERSARR
jgi:tetratricopeptide (TPR) repeat protein